MTDKTIDFDRLMHALATGAVACIFVAVAGGNGIFGWKNGGVLGVAFAVGIYLFGAWLPLKWGSANRVERAILAVLIAMSFAFTQLCGWQAIGLKMADAAVVRDAEATDRGVAKEALKQKREARAALGTPRALSDVEPREKLECGKVSSRYPDGVGPACTDLRAELGRIRQAAVLDREIAEAAAAFTNKKQTADGTPGLDQVAAIASLLTPTTSKDVSFWLPVFMVLLFDLAAYFGPVLLGLHASSGPPAAAGRWQGGGGSGGGGGGQILDDDEIEARYRSHMPRLPAPDGMRKISLPGEAAGDHSSASAPINITVGYPMLGAPGSASGADPTRSEARQRAADPPPLGGAVGAPATIVPRRDLPAMPDAPAVDRSHVARELSAAERPAADVLLHFVAACIVRTPGGVVDLQHLYRRYQRWAGERALAMESFKELLRVAAGVAVDDIAGMPHAHGVTLRAAAELKVA